MRKAIQPRKLPDPRPRYTQGVLTKPGRVLFIAGQTAVDEKGNVVGKGNIEAQAGQVFENIKAILAEAGGSFDNLVKTTTYITNIKYREGYNRVLVNYYKKNAPTSTLVVVKGLPHKDYLIEIEGIAVL